MVEEAGRGSWRGARCGSVAWHAYIFLSSAMSNRNLSVRFASPLVVDNGGRPMAQQPAQAFVRTYGVVGNMEYTNPVKLSSSPFTSTPTSLGQELSGTYTYGDLATTSGDARVESPSRISQYAEYVDLQKRLEKSMVSIFFGRCLLPA